MNIQKPRTPLHWLRIYQLYKEAFPHYERKPFAVILSMYTKGKTDIWYIRKDGHFVGIVITVNRDNAVLIDYLAISKEARSQGIGSEILSQMQKQYFPRGIFVEIESVFTDCKNKEERLRRKSFYLRNGMLPMNVMVVLFGVEMELLGINCNLTFDEYYKFYHDVYGDFANKHVWEAQWPKDL